jgi:energy-coupling factor transporter ATP-binding protein EcfA2
MSPVEAPGSRWYRWDLHVHAPGTLLNDQFTGSGDEEKWDRWCRAIEECEEIVGLGVTEYFILDTFERVLEQRRKGRLQNIRCLVANVEFRFDPPNDPGRAVQFHLLVDSAALEDATNLGRAKTDLAALKFRLNAEHSFPCSKEGLVELGRTILGGSPRDALETDQQYEIRCLREGAKQFKPSIETFLDWLEQPDRWLRKHAIVVVASGNDGVTHRADGWQAVEQRGRALADAVFSGNPKDREYWLGKKSGTEADRERFRLPKPCIHGSDAHSWDRLLKPDQDRKCWIKAEPTFEGLRQILLEPEERVHIGPTAPAPTDPGKIVRSLTIRDPARAFDDAAIPFHPGLTAIIGQRGSGKSALVELLAHAGAADLSGKDRASFLHRAERLLEQVELEIAWADDSKTVRRFAEPLGSPARIVILPQAFVELLADPDRAPELLQRRLQEVLFEAVPAERKLGCASFETWWDARTSASRERRQALQDDLSRSLEQLAQLVDDLLTLSDLPAKLEAAKQEHQRLEQLRRETATSSVTDGKDRFREEYEQLRQSHTKYQQRTDDLRRRRQKIEGLRDRLRSIETELVRLNADIARRAEEAGLPEEIRSQLRIDYVVKPEPLLQQADSALAAELAELKARAHEPADGGPPLTEEELLGRIEELRGQLSEDEERLRRLRELEEQCERAKARVDELRELLEVRERNVSARGDLIEKRIHSLVQQIIENLAEEGKLRDELTADFKTLWSGARDSAARLDVGVRRNIAVDKWLESIREVYNQKLRSVNDAFDANDGIQRMLEDFACAWTSDATMPDADAMTGALVGIVGRLVELHEKDTGTRGPYRSGKGLRDALRSVMPFEHLGFSFSLQYQGVDVGKLSAGMRGILLLELYLNPLGGTRDPILVDQPDANLDTKAVVDVLCPLLREVKRQRQVVIVTHNPNLVVNTDAELVIVAQSEERGKGTLPKMRYKWGALEGKDQSGKPLKQTICGVMEGGEEAFLRREKRYDLKRRTPSREKV